VRVKGRSHPHVAACPIATLCSLGPPHPCPLAPLTAQQVLLDRYAEQAKAADLAFDRFSPERGHAFNLGKPVLKGVGAVSCVSCHRKNPREQISAHRTAILCRARLVIDDDKHPAPKQAKVGYTEPVAPHATPKRFSEYIPVEQFFECSCQMVLERECTAREKGDLIAWLRTLEGEALYPDGRATGPVHAQK
jgi:hypothetical protein